MKKLLMIVCLMAVAVSWGCARPIQQPERAPLKHPWSAIDSTDKFADVQSFMVTIGSYGSTESILYTTSLSLYPFIEKRGEEMTVGIRSGGSSKVPVGTVQLRIDGNKTWTIEPSETPLYFAPANLMGGISSTPTTPRSGNPQQDAYIKQLQENAKNMQQNAIKNMSPFTAATGEKAKSIIKEMMTGQTIIYRKVGVNQAASSEGSANLDQSFKDAMIKAGITLEMLD